ncbi:hypothetical protein SR914_16170 [Comamonas testosteroni]|uniref:Membrane protein n=2 Tax=Comamonas testosteroni TaxID=285 RepID=A0A076PT94_COMTE|nr:MULTISPECIES: hypothetical protein [Comamonas]AIJ47911.1 membrane protein [Comamonas testosteroni TK102]EED66514.1 putative inner membrane transmembrane protein [Comamonas testosteroni KF-1]MPS91626.1 hypothetical protein [Comamonas sp.]TYK68467.1 hypothetical protein FSY59_23060 [Comamonas sp. Z3]WQG64751.1 hypothetical protein SR914_16170 [Comamonas testosteroni]
MNQPTPAIVAQSAVRRLPRWALLLLCLAYVIPGFVMRGPWRSNDMEAFGYMRELALGHTDWLSPTLSGLAPSIDGLLPYWLGALSLLGFEWLLGAEMAARLPFIALLILTLAATWWGAYYLARTPGAQPVAFAFGGEAQLIDYARAMADAALLALVACLGLAQLSHETTSYVTQLGCTTLLFFAAAAMAYHPRKSVAALIFGLLGLALSGAPTLAVLFGLGGSVIAFTQRSWGDNPGRSHRQARIWAAAWMAATVLAASLTTALDQWVWHLVDSLKDWSALLQLLLWFCWPAWPLALWTLWVWRRQIAYPGHNPHLSIALLFATVPVAACLSSTPADRALLLGLPAIATLAAFALPTFRRSISALIDWFTLLFFTASAIAIWVVWLAFQTGFPPKIAANIARLAPQFEASISWPTVIVALVATAGWFALVVWRTSRNRAAIWKSLVLPAGGATLSWVLLSTLWMEPLDHARSYQFQMTQLDGELRQSGATSCVLTYGLGRSQIAAVRYYTHVDTALLRRSDPRDCGWALVDADRWAGDHNRKLRQGWSEVSRITRLAGQKEVLVLLKYTGPKAAP